MASVAIRIGTVIAERAASYIVRALPPILGGTGGVIAGEEIEKRRQDASQAKASPMAQVDAATQEKEKCEKCPPAAGNIFQRNFTELEPWMVYQAHVTGMKLTSSYLEEWSYLNKRFDGFQLSSCHLMEAKAGHAWLFDGGVKVKYPFYKRILDEMEEDALEQNRKAKPRPPVKYSWFFEEQVLFDYMQPKLLAIGPDINVVKFP